MLNFAKRIERRITGVSLKTFLEDEDIQDAILYAIGHVGEYANAVSEEARAKHYDILWNALIGIRNRVFHAYGDVDIQIVYEAAVEHTPKLIAQLQLLLGEGKNEPIDSR
jgi:uncharacterized protein with HEPN domain